VVAVLGGFGAAACWATATLCASRSTRMIGAWSVLAWVMLVGFVVTAPLVAVRGIPDALGRDELVWLALSGAGNVGGLLFAYKALRLGKVSIVAPITSTEGAIAAVLAVVTGETLGVGAGLMLIVIAVGVVLAGIGPGGGSGEPLRATLFAGCAALCFGVSLYATARAGDVLPLSWAVFPARLLGVVAVTIPLAATGRLRLTRKAVPLVVTSGLCEVLGFASYALGARHGIAVAAVLASQFAALAAIAAYFLFHERLTRLQLTGIVTIAVGVAVLTAIQA
jgi:drug/metabolite transporter (DMT)-like permease